jgi:hypothetical protein
MCSKGVQFKIMLKTKKWYKKGTGYQKIENEFLKTRKTWDATLIP